MWTWTIENLVTKPQLTVVVPLGILVPALYFRFEALASYISAGAPMTGFRGSAAGQSDSG
jgi:hypothetical protein